MFAYCNNNPVRYLDFSGNLPTTVHEAEVSISGNAGNTGEFDEYLKLKASFQKKGISWFYSIEGALSAWSAIYLPKSQIYEYVTYLYSTETPLGTRYFMSQTYRGTKANRIMSANVLWGTFALAFQDAFYSVNLVAHVHTHPDPGNGFHNDFPSVDPDIHGGDRMVYNLLNLPEMYIIPFKRCNGTPEVIVYSDRSTWCSHHS